MVRTSMLGWVLVLGMLAGPVMACEMEDCVKAKGHGDAHAEGHGAGHSDMNMDSTEMGADLNEATKALDTAMAAMHKAMMVPYTGDPDLDFVQGMVPHHQGAIDMAQVVLKYGKDAQVRKLAREIIRAQELEIKWMNSYAKQLRDKRAGVQDKGWLGETRLFQ
jgi:uncharacterized protein (DUF305 family)